MAPACQQASSATTKSWPGVHMIATRSPSVVGRRATPSELRRRPVDRRVRPRPAGIDDRQPVTVLSRRAPVSALTCSRTETVNVVSLAGRDRACASRWPSSTPPSATSTATWPSSLDAYDRAEAAGCDIVAFPELSITGYPPEDLVLKPGFVADNEAALGQARRPHPPLRGRRRLRRRGPRPVQRRRGLRQRRGARHVPQAAAAELRRVRRGPLLHARQRDRPARAVRHRRRQGRHQHLRGHVEPRRPARRAGRRRRRAGDQHQRLAVPPRQGRLPRADAGHPGRRRPLGARLRQPGRRPGRAGLRRLLAGVRRRGQPARPGPAVPSRSC